MQKNFFSVGNRTALASALVAISISTLMSAQPTPLPPGLTEAAQGALKRFLPSLDSAVMKERHGFPPEDDFKDLRLDEPFEPFYLKRDATKTDAAGKYAGGKVTEVLAPSANWYFPVRSRGRLACLVSVVQWDDGKLVEDKLGMPELARAWAAIREAWPASKGFTPYFIIVPSHQLFYFTVPQVDPPNMTLVAIEKKESALPKTYERLSPASEAFAFLAK